MIKWFGARFDGKCAACKKQFLAGDLIGYVTHEDTGTHLVGLLCCEGNGTEIPEVMPRSKTAKDICMSCFVIHANGQKECE